MDTLIVVLSALLAWLFFSNPFGAGHVTNAADVLLARVPGIVIGLGTLLLAVLVALGVLLGTLLDRGGWPAVKDFFLSIFHKR